MRAGVFHRRGSRARPLGAAILAAILLPFWPGPSAPAAGDPAAELDMAYVQRVIEDLTAIGSTDLGFRAFGTPQDLESAEYVAAEMSAIGLQDVATESVPGDGWLFEGASVEVSGADTTELIRAGSFGGVPGTPAEGVTGELVFGGYGTARDYRNLDLDAEGKIVFAWWNPDLVWPNHMAYEAKVHGAKALIIATQEGAGYYEAETGLGSFDATCDLELCAPFVTIARQDAAPLAARLQQDEALQATVTLNATVTGGATGYNVVGVIPGSVDPEHVIVIGAHHDAWWFGAADATSGVAMTLALAKAVVDSGYQPRYTWVFTTHTGEEYGIADAYYDWLYGAFWQITQEHPEWQTDAVAWISFEGHAPPYEIGVNATQEMWPFVDRQLSQTQDLLPSYQIIDIYSWNEAWTFGAAGVPSVNFGSFPARFETRRYHTQLDSIDRLDLEGLLPVFQAETELVLAIDGRVGVPYRFQSRLGTLEQSLSFDVMKRWGFGARAMKRALADLDDAWGQAEAVRSTAEPACYDGHLRETARVSLTGFTGLSAWDDTVYPQQQLESDIEALGGAIRALRHGHLRTAATWIRGVAQNWYIPFMSEESFRTEMSHHAVDYPKISWGGQGHLAPYLDLWDTFTSLKAKADSGVTNVGTELATLLTARRGDLKLYGKRLEEMISVMEAMTDELTAAATC